MNKLHICREVRFVLFEPEYLDMGGTVGRSTTVVVDLRVIPDEESIAFFCPFIYSKRNRPMRFMFSLTHVIFPWSLLADAWVESRQRVPWMFINISVLCYRIEAIVQRVGP